MVVPVVAAVLVVTHPAFLFVDYNARKWTDFLQALV